MAKRKTKTVKKNKPGLEQFIVKLILSLIAVTLVTLSIFNYGLVGQTGASVLHYVVGDYYAFFAFLMVISGIWIAFNHSDKNLKTRYLIAVILVFISSLTFQTILFSESLMGKDVLSNFIANSEAIYQREMMSGGGIIGSLVYSLFSILFDKTGSMIVCGVIILIAIILLLDFDKLKNRSKEYQHSLLKRNPKKSKETKLTVIDNEGTTKKQKSRSFINLDQIEEEPIVTDVVDKKPKADTLETEQLAPVPRTNSAGAVKTFNNYILPKLDILDKVTAGNQASSLNTEAAKVKGKRLIEILANFGIPATLLATHIGPSVTKFEVRPDSSVKVNRINTLSDNLKMELAAKDIRIEAPIPGRNAVGIEIPNVETSPVRLYELMRSIPSAKASKRLLLALGKDLMGQTVYCELDRMPHLLIAGATGSGKSVCVNSIISTLLLRTSPHEVKLVLIDPKKVEFTQYANVPHLISPIISDAEEASRSLKKIVEMMENRYNAFAEVGVRNIAGYNDYILSHPDAQLESFPWIVVIIDELADLMAISGKEVELSIQRITQLARAAGIHLIVATQRPSTDVITGIIKTNIPSRISFAVSSGTDSRIILDQTGAERLLGNGDMLYYPIGEPAAVRAQGVYVSDDEINRIAEFTSSQMKPDFDDAFLSLEADEIDGARNEMIDKFNDSMYEEVKQYVIEEQKASTSLLQRRFGIGYNRAARIIDVLEARGVIGPVAGSKPREVYIKKEDSNNDQDERQ